MLSRAFDAAIFRCHLYSYAVKHLTFGANFSTSVQKSILVPVGLFMESDVGWKMNFGQDFPR